jgi:RimJ/RimL family protein N-acetyltransferase
MGGMRLVTEVGGLTLRTHEPADAEELRRLLAENAEHLMSSGDYNDEIATTASQWREQFAAVGDGGAATCSFGIWLDERELVGRIVLTPVAPPSYAVGYWVTNPQQGKGFASASLAAIVRHAATLGATDLFAGVNHGNAASRRVLEKCGFVEVADVDTYTRFHRRIDPLG